MAASQYQLIVRQAQQLSPQEQLRLIQQLAEQLAEREAQPPQPADDEAARSARERFARWIGAVNSGNPNSADNEQIDADLAREYGATHEDE